MSIAIHAVKAVYNAATFNPSVMIQKDQPIEYRCVSCSFRGNLGASVEHAVTNQFVVKDKVADE